VLRYGDGEGCKYSQEVEKGNKSVIRSYGHRGRSAWRNKMIGFGFIFVEQIIKTK
jgi:hypothetical protein